jgi:hypothetical protein
LENLTKKGRGQRAEGRRQKERSINKNFSSGIKPSLKKELYRDA